MNTTILLIIGVPILLFAIFNFLLGYASAGKNTHSTEIGLDKIKFGMKGKEPFVLLGTLKKAGFNRHGLIVETHLWNPLHWWMIWKNFAGPYINPVHILLKVWFGIWWVSWFYPQRQLHKFTILDIHRYHGVGPDGDMRNAIEIQPRKDVDELYRILTRPYYREIVLGQDSATIGIVVLAECEVVDPVKAVHSLNGDFFRRLDPSIKSQLEDWVNTIDFPTFLKTSTGKGQVLALNLEKINHLIIASCGIKVTDCYIEEMRPVGILADAAAKEAVAKVEAKVLRINTEAEAKSRSRLALVTALETSLPIKSMKKLGVDVDLAAESNERIQVFREIKGTQLTTFVEGGERKKRKKSKATILLP
jgi:hypothetical protein